MSAGTQVLGHSLLFFPKALAGNWMGYGATGTSTVPIRNASVAHWDFTYASPNNSFF